MRSISAVLASLLLTSVALAQTKPAPSVSASSSASAAPSAAPLGPSASADDVAAKIQVTYNSITTYEADFEQQYAMKAFNTTKTSKGHVTFVKPGKMRWDYTEPKEKIGDVVVSDGVTLWSYTASEKQARKMLVKDSQMPTALAFLTGTGNLAKEFNLKLLDASKMKFAGGYVLEARPKAATNLYAFIIFYVDGQTYQVRRVLIVDGQDNRNRFDFTKPTVNGTIPQSKFQWTPPVGATTTTN